jgi:hypothetical protein
MSQIGGSQYRAAAQGPYGPDNAPPPPPGRSDSKQSHTGNGAPSPPANNSLPAKGPGRAYLHRKLNSRQRKKRKQEGEQATPNLARDRGRSRSPTRESQGSSTFRQREQSPIRQTDNWERAPRQSKRQSLREARQFTPDQIMDETYGRLSPTVNLGNVRQEPNDHMQRRSARRMDWPDDPLTLPQHEDLDQTKQPLLLGSEFQGREKAYNPRTKKEFRS